MSEVVNSVVEQVMIAERLCEKCQKMGKTSTYLKVVPHFKDMYFEQFDCNECGFKIDYIDFKEKGNDFGIQILFKCLNQKDHLREVIHSQLAIVRVNQLDLQLNPSKTTQICSIRSLIERVVQELNFELNNNTCMNQNIIQETKRKLQKAEHALQAKLFPLTFKIRDPSGNSNIKSLNHPLPDKNIQVCYFERTVEQLMQIGFSKDQAEEQVKRVEQSKKGIKLNFNQPFTQQDFMHKEPVIFEMPCGTCMQPGQMKLCQTSIPYFTDLVIMSFNCDFCGAHSVETKNGGQVHDQALEITLTIDNDRDLKRDLFKSETCKVCIPQVQLELDFGTLGGQYTTVQGLLQKIHDHLGGNNTFIDRDQQFSSKMQQFLDKLWDMRDGKTPFTLMLIDPLSRSFLQNPFHPQQDKTAKRLSRQRNEEEQDFLGFTGMNVDNYK